MKQPPTHSLQEDSFTHFWACSAGDTAKQGIRALWHEVAYFTPFYSGKGEMCTSEMLSAGISQFYPLEYFLET